MSTNGELNRLITAALISEPFRNLLLNNPEMAVDRGYNGEIFRLTPEEREMVVSIQATSLVDYARQLVKRCNGNGYKNRFFRMGSEMAGVQSASLPRVRVRMIHS